MASQNDNEENHNPGIMLDLAEQCTNVFPKVFDGFKVVIYKNLSQHLKVCHNIYLSSITPGNYRFGTTYVGSKVTDDHRGLPVLMGDISSKGNLNAIIYHVFGSRLHVRFDGQMENNKFAHSELTAHYLGNSFTFSTVLADANFFRNSGTLLFQYLQSLTSKLALGAEVAHIRGMKSMRSPAIINPTTSEYRVSIVGKYSTPFTTWSTVLSLHNILLCYYKKASDQLDFGVEFNSNFKTRESVGSIGFQVKLPDRGIIFKGFIDSNTNVGSVFEQRICDSPFSFSLSFNLNQRNSDFRLGVGFTVE